MFPLSRNSTLSIHSGRLFHDSFRIDCLYGNLMLLIYEVFCYTVSGCTITTSSRSNRNQSAWASSREVSTWGTSESFT